MNNHPPIHGVRPMRPPHIGGVVPNNPTESASLRRPPGMAIRPTPQLSSEVLKQEAIERARQLAALQEQIAAAQKNLQLSGQVNSTRPMLHAQRPMGPSSFGFKKGQQVQGQDKGELKNPYLESHSTTDISTRKPRSFHFIEKGKFEAEAQKLRAKDQLEKLQRQIAESAKKAGMESVVDIDISVLQESIPEVEWWDSVILKAPSYDNLDSMVKYETITHYVQHPIPLKTSSVESSSIIIPVMLTSKETKKLRRQRRLALEKEKQDKIRMGLIPPPEPKVKRSNFMKVLGNEAIQDPTKIEDKVRQQIEQRLQTHLAANEARKLTPEQRRDKKRKKLLEDLSKETRAMVFRLENLSDPQKRYKIDINAQQLYLSGCCLITPDFVLIIVEGGRKSLRRYKKLMLNRIKWLDDSNYQMSGGLEYESDEESSDEDERESYQPVNSSKNDASSSSNSCVLLWEGTIKKPSFRGFRCKEIDNEKDIRDLLSRFNAEHYYDAAKNYVPSTD